MGKTRKQVMEWLEENTDFIKIQLSEDFYINGRDGGIWLCGEGDNMYKGNVIYDYYNTNYKKYDIGVLIPFQKKLEKMGWWSEWYDAGTITIWQND